MTLRVALDVTAPVPNRRLSLQQRLRRSALFRETYDQKRSFHGRYMVLWVRSASDASLRLGVVASRRMSRRAVGRSRAKRLLREAYRLSRDELRGDVDVVLIARRDILKVGIDEVRSELMRLAGKAGLAVPKKQD